MEDAKGLAGREPLEPGNANLDDEAGEPDEEINDRSNDRRVEHLRCGVVVPRSDALVEVAIVGVHPLDPTGRR